MPHATAVLSPRLVIALTAGMMMMQPLATDLYQPTLPSIGTDFGVGVSTVQLTLTVFIATFGLWQLIAGPLSDRFGRYPVIITGVFTFAAASALCMLAPTIEWLVAARALQAAGACACLVCARAMVRDLFAPAEGARVLAISSTLLGIAPLVGPIAGGLLLAAFGWRSAFAALLLLALAFGVFTLARLRETNPLLNPRALQPGPMLRTYAAVLRAPTWHAYTWTAATSYAGLFAFISGGSFVLIRVLGVPAALYGLCFSFVVSGYVIGTLVCRHSVEQVGVARTLARGATLQVSAGLAIAALAWAGIHHPLAILVPQFFFLAAHGLILPVAQAGAVARFRANAGAASALMGCTMMVVAAAVGTWIGASYDGTVYPLALTIAAAGLATAIATVTLVHRHGQVD